MAKTQPCQIRLLNKQYEIKCPTDKLDALTQAAKKLDGFMQKYKHQFPLLDDNKLLLLSALEISFQLIEQPQDQNQGGQKEVDALIHSLENRINAVVGKEKA